MSGYQILIIDDAVADHDVLGEYLRLEGYEVSHAYDGVRGLDAMRAECPDLVLLDVVMPLFDGFQTIDAMKRDPDLATIPVIFLTSLDRTNLIVRGLELGAEDYLIKPPKRAELIARVRKAIRSCQRFEELQGAMTGDVSEFGVSELLQTFDLSRKSARITLPAMDADLHLAEGQLTGARLGTFVGIPALRRILLSERGRFVVDFDHQAPVSAEPMISIQEALMQAYIYLDEMRQVMDGLPPGDEVVELVPERGPLEGLSGPLQGRAVPLLELLTSMECDLKTAALALGEAFETGAVRLVEEHHDG